MQDAIPQFPFTVLSLSGSLYNLAVYTCSFMDHDFTILLACVVVLCSPNVLLILERLTRSFPAACIHMLPAEVIALVFAMLLSNFTAGTKSYGQMRGLLAHVCARWRVILFAEQTLWQDITVSVHTRPEIIDFLLARAPTIPLNLCITLQRRAHHSAATTLKPFVEEFPRCRSIRIKILDQLCLHLLAANLRGLRFHSLEYLHLTCTDTHVAILIPVFEVSRSLNQLRSLCLRRIAFSWDAASTFISLTTLVLRDIPSQFAPDWSFWSTIAAVAVSLKNLCVRHTACLLMPINPGRLDFPRLTHLDLAFGTEPSSIYDVIAVVFAPSLTHLALSVERPSSAACLLSYVDMLQNVTNLVLDISHADEIEEDVVHHFLARLPSVQSLELLGSETEILRAMSVPNPLCTNDNNISGFVCPLLRTLIVDYESPTVVKEFMVARAGVSERMKEVFFCEELTEEDQEDDFEWLDDRLRVILNSPDRQDHWISEDEFIHLFR